MNRLITIVLCILSFVAFASGHVNNTPQNIVIKLVQHAKNYIQNKGKGQAILQFQQKSSHIFAISYDGIVLASPIHPETVGTNQFDFKDASGLLAVQEEINKAKAGGGWLKGRLRFNPITKKYACRKLYIQPMPIDYFIGSWYYYPPTQKNDCLI